MGTTSLGPASLVKLVSKKSSFDLLAGSYKLTNRIAGQPIWRLRVEFKPGEQKTLDLTPANSIAARDDFPETL